MHGKNNRHGVEEMEEIHLFNERTYVELVNMKCCYEGRGSPEILSACFYFRGTFQSGIQVRAVDLRHKKEGGQSCAGEN